MKHCTKHAAHRWAERVMHLKHPKPADITAASKAVEAACESARVTRRFRNRTRVLVTPEGIHLVVKRCGAILTVLGVGQPQAGCHCDHCLRVRADRAKKRGH